jgi:hypothetical protein
VGFNPYILAATKNRVIDLLGQVLGELHRQPLKLLVFLVQRPGFPGAQRQLDRDFLVVLSKRGQLHRGADDMGLAARRQPAYPGLVSVAISFGDN